MNDVSTEERLRTVPLERRLPLLVLALFTLVLATTLVVSYYEVRRSAIETASERLTGLDQVFGSIIEQQTTARLGQMRRAARDTAVLRVFRTGDTTPAPSVARAIAPFSTSPADTATPPRFWDPRGQRLGNPHLELSADRQRFHEEVVQETAANDSGHVTRLHVSNGHASYFLAVPVHDGAGTLLGYIAQERRINVNPRALPILRGLLGPDVEFFFRNVDDNTWVELSGATTPPPTSTHSTDSLAIYRHGGRGNVLGTTTPVRGTPFLLTVERPMSAILARPLAAVRVLVVLAIVLAVIGALAVWTLSRRLVRPLGDLTRAAEAMSRGEYTERVAVNRRDEVGRLGVAFNRMAEEVQASSETSTRAVERLTRSIERQQFLADASELLARSVSDEHLLADLTVYCVPRLADYCSIHIADEDGAIRRIETAHRDPGKLPTVRAMLSRFQYTIDSSHDVPTVIRTQQPVRHDVDLDRAIADAPDDDTRRLLREIAPTAAMIVPLVARGQSIGAMSFVMAGSHRTFSDDDLDLAMELARRTAIAIDNAVIYRRSVRLRLEAEAASNAKSDFLAKMSHEIRTPINAMMGYAELLEMGISGPVTEAQSKQLSRIRASGDHLTHLIGEILDLSKIEAGRMSVQATVAPVGDAVESSLATVRPLASTKGVALTSSLNGNAGVEYHGDPQRVQQILTNLLSNAVKFTPSGGAVQVRAEPGARPDENGGANRWVCIAVTDSGVGIAQEDLERIFQPFVQIDTGYTRSQGGTGLGLTISRTLAQLMGGEITVESSLGHGSTFILWLPRPNPALMPA